MIHTLLNMPAENLRSLCSHSVSAVAGTVCKPPPRHGLFKWAHLIPLLLLLAHTIASQSPPSTPPSPPSASTSTLNTSSSGSSRTSSVNSNSSASTTLRTCPVGILVPEDPRLYGLGADTDTFRAALSDSLAEAQRVVESVCGLREVVMEVNCTNRSSVEAVFSMNLSTTPLVIGPPCSDAATGLVLLGRQVVTWIPLHSHPDIYDQGRPAGQGQGGLGTLAVSSYGTFEGVAQSVMATLTHFHWSKIVTVFSQDQLCGGLRQALNHLQDCSRGSPSFRHLGFQPLNASSMDQALAAAQGHYRILVTCSDPDIFHDLLTSAERLGMTSEHYVIVHVTLGYWDTVGEVFKSVASSHASLSSGVLFVGHFASTPRQRRSAVSRADASNGTSDRFLGYFHDALMMWAEAQKRAGAGQTPQFSNINVTGNTGRLEMGEDGTRTQALGVWQWQQGSLVHVAQVTRARFTPVAPPMWSGGSLPSDSWDEPGRSNVDAVVGGVLGSVFAILVLLLAACVFRRWRQDRLSKGRAWQVEDRDVKRRHQTHITSQNGTSHPRRLTRMETRGTLGLGSICSLDRNQLFAPVGNYRGVAVAVKTIQCRSFRLSPDIIADLNILKDLSHDNFNTFVGAHVEPGNTYVLFKYCAKGSLQDVLENEDITLDWMFKMSFGTDLARGMEYLHKSALKSHGNLKSTNCVIDSRWVLKVTDFGAVTSPADEHDDMSHTAICNALLWTAPELVRMSPRPRKGSQKGDVFSFAIIMQEILFRVGPYGHDCCSPEEIIENVKKGGTVPFRPHIPQDPDVPEKALTLLTSCWDETPELRPEFNVIRKRLLELNGGKKVSMVDNMLTMMETYSGRLELLVADRTAELAQEKAKTDRLLYQMLPQSVAEQLKSGRAVVPEFYDSVSIFFSDIVGFTNIASQSKPLEIVELLNDLYTAFDDVICRRDVYKVETIGDAYMCVSGCPRRNGRRHANEIADMALDLVATVSTVRVRHRPDESLQLRVGLHTGPCAAGVVGVAMPRYCLFGDTVNMASRMESTGKALHIHISSDMKASLDDLDCGFLTLERGMIQVKGKGVHKTYWLVGREGYTKTLPETFSKLRQTLGESNSRPYSPSNTSLNVGDGMYSALRKTSLAVNHYTVTSDSDDASTIAAESAARSESGVDTSFPWKQRPPADTRRNADDLNRNDDVFTKTNDADAKHVSIGETTVVDPKLGAIPRIEIS